MIVHYNVCEQCGNQKQIETEKSSPEEESRLSNGFVFSFSIQSLYSVLNNRYGTPKYQNATFCDKDCLIEYLKINIKKVKEDK